MAAISASPEMVRGSLPWARPRGRAGNVPQYSAGCPPESAVTTGVVTPVGGVFPWRIAAVILSGFVATLILSGPIAQGATSVADRVPAAAPAAAPESVAHPAYTVEAGDTLWALGQRWAPQTDPRATVAAIRELNGLSPEHQLQAGEVLMLPTGA